MIDLYELDGEPLGECPCCGRYGLLVYYEGEWVCESCAEDENELAAE